jgi:hypothetical protein
MKIFSRENKKANVISDTLLPIIVLTVVGISAVFAKMALSDFRTEMEADPTFQPEAKAQLQQSDNTYAPLMDGLFIFVLAGLWIAAIVFSFRIDTHPIFMVLSIILLAFILFVGAILSNTYQEISTEPDLLAAHDEFPMMNFVFDNFLIIILAIAFSIFLALFAKARFG